MLKLSTSFKTLDKVLKVKLDFVIKLLKLKAGQITWLFLASNWLIVLFTNLYVAELYN